MKIRSKIKSFFESHIAFYIVMGVAALCTAFLLCGTKAENGSITLDGSNAKIQEYTEKFIEDSNAALYRIMNEDAPTDEATIEANEATGQGSSTTLAAVLARRLPDGDTDNGLKWQCSKYTGYLATGKREYSSVHTDYGPVNGKDVAAWLVRNYGWKYIDTPIEGAIGSGGFNTTYGHTAMYLYSTGANTAMVNDANYVPLTVGTHNMNISGWVWVVPGDYTPDPSPSPSPSPEPSPVSSCSVINVVRGDTMGAIMKRCEGSVVYGEAMNNYAKTWYSTIVKPGQSVYDGWVSGTGVGLYAGDTIERRE
ncbi:hypothetical protein IJJ05_00415 [Candidatus Saccharibacteria bacterium]|nr:hypothetical protein [Candidatus Saccharibacteria bacterium]